MSLQITVQQAAGNIVTNNIAQWENLIAQTQALINNGRPASGINPAVQGSDIVTAFAGNLTKIQAAITALNS